MNALLGRTIYALIVLAFFGVVPVAVVLVTNALAWLPLAVAAAAVSPLWGLSFLRGLLPMRGSSAASVQRLGLHADAVALAAGVQVPWVSVKKNASVASISWCNEQPRLTFPELWLQQLDDEELQAYVAHELAHAQQREYRALLAFNRISLLIGAAMAGFGFVMVAELGSGAIPLRTLVVYCCLPVTLTLILVLRPLILRRTMVLVETAADDQAVQWGASPGKLADVLERLDTPAMRVPLPPDVWLLNQLSVLLSARTVRGRVLRLRQTLAPAGEAV